MILHIVLAIILFLVASFFGYGFKELSRRKYFIKQLLADELPKTKLHEIVSFYKEPGGPFEIYSKKIVPQHKDPSQWYLVNAQASSIAYVKAGERLRNTYLVSLFVLLFGSFFITLWMPITVFAGFLLSRWVPVDHDVIKNGNKDIQPIAWYLYKANQTSPAECLEFIKKNPSLNKLFDIIVSLK